MHSVSKQFYIIVILIAAGIFFITGYFAFSGLYGQDAYSYLLQSKNLFTGDYHLNFYPPVYAFSGWVLQLVFQNYAVSLQLVSLIAVVVSTILVWKIVVLQYNNERHALSFSIIIFLLSPFMLRASVLVMSDALAMMFCVACLFFYNIKSPSSTFWIYLFFTLSILTRYATAPLLTPVLIFNLWHSIKRKQFVYLIGGVGMMLVLLGSNFLFWSTEAGGAKHQWLHLWQIQNFFKSSFSTPDGIQDYFLPNVLFPLKALAYPGFMPLFFILLFFLRKGDVLNNRMLVPLLSLLIYFIFLSGIPFQNDRFLVIAYPFVALIMYPAFSRILERFKPSLLIVFMVCIVQITLAFRAVLPMYYRSIIENEIANALEPYQGKILYSFDMDIALKGKGLNFEYRNLNDDKIANFEDGSLLLFNESKFQKQWKGMNPMLNFKYIQENCLLDHEKDFSDDWKLYLIKPKQK